MWCGSCWAFSTTAALESLQAITSGHGPPVSLSEQMLMDCGSHFVPGSNSYCNGGDPMAAFWYINNTGGICSDADYPCAHTHAAACQPAMPPRLLALNAAGWVEIRCELRTVTLC
jgi:C1A family cysteine protease